MRPGDRRRQIVDHLMAVRTETPDALADRFGVSRMTIHRDLDGLQAEGVLRKMRGSVSLEASGRFESDFRFRARSGAAEKRAIAARAAEFVRPGMSVFVDDGSTAAELAPALAARGPLTVITHSQAMIGPLMGAPGIELISLGGTFSAKFNGFFGTPTLAALGDLRADLALVSAAAVEGRTAWHQDRDVLEVKRRMIASAARSVLMVDHGKFGRTALHHVADLGIFMAVVTTRAIGANRIAALSEQGVELIFAEDDDG